MFKIEFMPFSINSWKKLLNNTGLLGYGVIFIILCGKVFVKRQSGDVISGSIDISMAHRFIFLILAFNIFLLNIKKFRIPNSLGLRLLLLYTLIAIISTTWSQATIVTFGKSIELFIGVSLILVASKERNNNLVLFSLLQIIYYLLFLQLIVVLVGFFLGLDGFYEKGAGGLADLLGKRCSGPFVSANSIGYFSTLLFTMFIGLLLHAKRLSNRNLIFFSMIILSLIFSTSRTSLAICIIFFLYFLFYKNKLLFSIFILPIFSIVSFKMYPLIISFIQGGTAHANLVTLSGRTVLWKYAIEYGMNQPFIGSGFGIGSRVMFFMLKSKGFGDTISTAHNGFLEVFLGTGLLGLIPWLISFSILLSICIKYFSLMNFRFSYLFGAWPVLFFTTIMSVGVGSALNEFFMISAIILAINDDGFFVICHHAFKDRRLSI